LRSLEKDVGLAALATFGGMFAVTALTRPRIAQVTAALTSGDVRGARIVLDGLKETQGDTSDVLDADDAVKIAESSKLALEDRLKILDAVVSRGGAHASEAKAEARKTRIGEIHRLVDAKTP